MRKEYLLIRCVVRNKPDTVGKCYGFWVNTLLWLTLVAHKVFAHSTHLSLLNSSWERQDKVYRLNCLTRLILDYFDPLKWIMDPPNINLILKVKVTKSVPLFMTPWTIQSLEFSRPEILEWVAIPFSRGSSQPRDWTQVSHIAGRFFTSWARREAQEYWSG